MFVSILSGCAPLADDAPITDEVEAPHLELGDHAPTTVIVIQVDTLRADATPWGGSERDTFPHLGTRDGWVSVEHAVAEGTWTGPSTASLMTSVGQELHGIRAFAEEGTPDPVAVQTWPTLLRSQGWSTGLFSGSELLMQEALGLGQGFDMAVTVADEPRNSEGVVGQAIGWLRQAPTDRPVLLFLHPVDPHGPYRPAPRDEGTWVDPDTLPFDPSHADSEQTQEIVDAVVAAADDEERTAILEAVRLAYDEQLLGLDRSLAMVFDVLAETGRLDSAVVVLTADHGESFLEGVPPWLGHGGVIRHEVVHIPMLFWTAETVTTSVDCVASNLDVFPTVLDLAGVELPADVAGQSLRRTCRNQAFSAVYERREETDTLSWIGAETGVGAVTWDCVAGRGFAFDLSRDARALDDVPVTDVPDGPVLDMALDEYLARIQGVYTGAECVR